IRHTSVIPIAGDQITNDIAVALRTPTNSAEEIKKKYGCALTQLTDPTDVFETSSVGGRPPRRVARQTLAEVVEPRVEEMYGLVLAELRRSGFEDLIGSGIVLTGGSSKLQGMVELAEEVFHQPVRLGVPDYTGGLKEVVCNPIYSTGIGLIYFGNRRRNDPASSEKMNSSIGSIMKKMKSWFSGSF
ncbi:MAG TPA: cell division protein FtsA, partial [Gammaproteobacteria bacterium]|nr:cell division protein FtsA [Gammaproteobacteria bacterium]